MIVINTVVGILLQLFLCDTLDFVVVELLYMQSITVSYISYLRNFQRDPLFPNPFPLVRV